MIDICYARRYVDFASVPTSHFNEALMQMMPIGA